VQAVAEKYEVPEEHVDIIMQAAGLQRYDANGNPLDLPDELYQTYVAFRSIRDRIDLSAISSGELAMVVMMSRKFSGWSPKPVTAYDIFKAGNLKPGDPLEVTFRNKKQKAVFIGGCGSAEEMIVQIVGDSEERRVPVESIKVERK
jgi:hypothetical protein